MKKESILRVLSNSCALDILEELSKSPLRFVDMERICRSKRTRYVRLKELEHKGLVKAVARLVAHRAYTFYEMTNKGTKALEIVRKILSMESDATDE